MTADQPRSRPPRPWLYLLAAAFPVLAAAILVRAYPAIPDTFAVHWGADGRPDRFADKSWLSVMALPLMTLVLVVLLSSTGFIQRSGGRAYPVTEDADAGVPMPWSDSATARVHFLMGAMNRWLGWMTIGVSLGMAIMSVGSAVPAYGFWMPVGATVTIASAVLAVVAALVTLSRVANGAGDVPPDEAELERVRILRDDRNHEKVHSFGGLIYYNPADPMLLVASQRQEHNVNFNTAHAPARRFFALMVGSLVLLMLIPLITAL